MWLIQTFYSGYSKDIIRAQDFEKQEEIHVYMSGTGHGIFLIRIYSYNNPNNCFCMFKNEKTGAQR
jgi:hypothetical protein